MAALISEGEEVHINIFSEVQEKEATDALKKAGVTVGQRVFLHPFKSYEPWCRDHGPCFVHRGSEVAIIDWKYNAWGGKYPPYDLDDAIPHRVAEFLNVPVFDGPMVLEGGSIDTNGEGTLLTTEACLLHPNRNPTMTQRQIEETICAYLGMEKILWLGEGIVEDDTDGHIDDLTRFVAPTTVVTVMEEDPDDDNYEPLQENRRRLETMTTARGEKLQVVELPMPGVFEIHEWRMPASYANFYIANAVVLMPAFSHPNDAVARETLQKLFPTRRVEAVERAGHDLGTRRVAIARRSSSLRRSSTIILCGFSWQHGDRGATCIRLSRWAGRCWHAVIR